MKDIELQQLDSFFRDDIWHIHKTDIDIFLEVKHLVVALSSRSDYFPNEISSIRCLQRSIIAIAGNI